MPTAITRSFWFTFFATACGTVAPTDAQMGAATAGTNAGVTSGGGAVGGVGVPGGAGVAVSGGSGPVASGGGMPAGAGMTGSGAPGVVVPTGGSAPVNGGAGGNSSGGTVNAGGTISAGGSEPNVGGAAGGGSVEVPVAVERPSVVTSANGAFWQVGELTDGTGANATFTVDDREIYQEWLGFGGTFNEAGWDVLSLLDEAERDRAIRLLFDEAEGAHFTFGRIPVGSSDYGLDRYTLNETDGDYAMMDFSVARDEEALIPFIQAALAVKPDIKFWGSPWSPPTWMKDNNAFDKGNMRSDAQTLEAHALYLSRWIEEYEARGINIVAMAPQNEPGFAQDYPSCIWSGSVFANYIADHLGPMFEERGIAAEIWLATMSNTTDAQIVNAVMGNQGAAAYVKGIGLQWGMVEQAGNYSGSYDFPIIQTEHKCGNYPWMGGNASRAPNDFAYGVESWDLLTQWINAGVSSYNAWNMVLDTVGRNLDTVRPWAQNALLVVDRQTRTLTETPTYYVFKHLAYFVDPGAVRIRVNGNALAFKNPDGSLIAVLRTSGTGATAVSIGGKVVQFQSAGNGWATVNLEPDAQ